MTNKLSNIELAYQTLKDKKDGMTFAEIWNAVAADINEPAAKKSRIMADLYSEMVLDNRFALTADGKWATRSNMSAADIKKQKSTAYDFDFDADFDDIDEDEEEDESDVEDSDDDDTDSDDEEEDDSDDEDDDDFTSSEDKFDDEDK